MKRPSKHEYYLNIAKEIAERGTCIRRKVGAVIVKEGVILSTGYVGSPRGTEHCTDRKECHRAKMGIPSGHRYELCRSVHGETNAIINAARSGTNVLGSTIYIYSKRIEEQYANRKRDLQGSYGPCLICKKNIINAGISRIIVKEEGFDIKELTKEDLINQLKEQENNR